MGGSHREHTHPLVLAGLVECRGNCTAGCLTSENLQGSLSMCDGFETFEPECICIMFESLASFQVTGAAEVSPSGVLVLCGAHMTAPGRDKYRP